MKLLFILSKWNINLAKEEALALAGTRKFALLDNILILDCPEFDFSRLAYTKKVLLLIFISDLHHYKIAISKVNWQKYYKGSFCVRAKNSPVSESELAGMLWPNLTNPKVNLSKPKSQFEFYFSENKVFCGRLIKEIKHKFKKVKHGSIALSPKLARAVINLTKIKPGQTLLDPFCGSGGLLLSAYEIKCKLIGSDTSKNMLYIAKKNMVYLKIKNYKLLNKDATRIKVEAYGIASDLPYGRRSSLHKQKLAKLIQNFLKNAGRILKKNGRAVIITPNIPNIPNSFKLIAVIKNYIHKSLTRHILILEKK